MAGFASTRDSRGRTILRFASFERFTHWLTASCFIILALSGLNVSFGRTLILPLFGADAFAAMSAWAKLAHNYLAFPFMLGLVIMFLIWIRDNIPGKLDLEWIKQGGGILPRQASASQALQRGAKGNFLDRDHRRRADVGVRLVPAVPVSAGNVTALQFWTVIHAVIAMLFIAAMLAHIYIGSIGMEGAFDAMGTGEVDVNWAKEHHSLWVEEEQKKAGAPPDRTPHAVPAE